jgi:hypothetical protein
VRDLCRKISAQISRKKSPFFFDVAKRPAFPQPPVCEKDTNPDLSFINPVLFLFGVKNIEVVGK